MMRKRNSRRWAEAIRFGSLLPLLTVLACAEAPLPGDTGQTTAPPAHCAPGDRLCDPAFRGELVVVARDVNGGTVPSLAMRYQADDGEVGQYVSKESRDGLYSFGGLPAGPLKITLTSEAYGDLSMHVMVVHGRPTVLTAVFGPGGASSTESGATPSLPDGTTPTTTIPSEVAPTAAPSS